MAYQPKDHYFKKAKKENFAARSVYKLQEIDKKYRIFKPGQKVLDLGAAPGSWTQYASQKIGGQGKVIGLDLSAVGLKVKNAVFVQGDIMETNFAELFELHGVSGPVDIVLSDMAPKTTGIKLTDQARSFELCQMALQVAKENLCLGGHFVCKLFQSSEFASFRAEIKRHFHRVESLRPQSTRKVSTEIFMIGLSFKGLSEFSRKTTEAP